MAIGLNKLIATYFAPSAYGTYFIASSAVTFYTTLVANPTIQSFRHEFHGEPGHELFTYYRSLFIWLGLLALSLLGLTVLSGLISFMLMALILGQVITNTLSGLQMAHINIRGYTTLQSILQVISPVLSILIMLAILFSGMNREYTALWVIFILAEGIVVLLGILSFKPNQQLTLMGITEIWRSPKFRNLVRYVRPLIALPVLVWIVNNADRYLLDLFCEKDEVGMYSAAYGLGAKLFVMVSGGLVAYLNAPVFQQARDPEQYRALYQATRKRLGYFLTGGLVLVLGMGFLYPWIGSIFLSRAYEPAFALIPALGFANLLLASVFLPEQVVYATGMTRYILYHYALGAGINLVFNLMLIPVMGMWGAAVAMMISSGSQLLFLVIILHRKLNQTPAIA